MKNKSKEAPVRRANDNEPMTLAIDFAETLGVPFWRPKDGQLKIGAINYYPTTGKMYHDEIGKIPERGLDGLKQAVARYIRTEKPISVARSSAGFAAKSDENAGPILSIVSSED